MPGEGKARFETVRVTRIAHELIQDLEQALLRMYVADTVEEISAAYTALNQRRRALYEHVEAAEEFTAWDRPVIKRF